MFAFVNSEKYQNSQSEGRGSSNFDVNLTIQSRCEKVNKFNIIEWIFKHLWRICLKFKQSFEGLCVRSLSQMSHWLLSAFPVCAKSAVVFKQFIACFLILGNGNFIYFHELKTWGLDQGHWVRLCFIQICIKCKYLSTQIFVYSMTKFLENSKSIFIGAQNLIRTTLKIGLASNFTVVDNLFVI